MFILVLSVPDVHKITIFLGKFGSTKTTVIRLCYVMAGRLGRAMSRCKLGRIVKMDKMSGPDQNFLAHAHLYTKLSQCQ